jgi:hypothetical protein
MLSASFGARAQELLSKVIALDPGAGIWNQQLSFGHDLLQAK